MFIVSLALADAFVAVFVMPFHIVSYIKDGKWIFGTFVCHFFLTLDILLCTSSILHLCCIALDRYWAIKDSIKYAQKRTMKLVLTMILIVWLSSALISMPVIIWNTKSVRAIESNTHHENTNNNKIPLLPILSNKISTTTTAIMSKQEEQIEIICDIPHDKLYRIYSSSGTFYVPLFIMTFVYVRIFLETKRRLHERAKAAKKLAKSMAQSQNQQTSDEKSKNFCYSCCCCCCSKSNDENEVKRKSTKSKPLKNEPELDNLNEEANKMLNKNDLDEMCLDNETSSPSINHHRNNNNNNNQSKNAEKLMYVDANEDSDNFQTKNLAELKDDQTPKQNQTATTQTSNKKVSIKNNSLADGEWKKNSKTKKTTTTTNTSTWIRDNANTGITLQQRQKISLTRERRAARTLGIIMGD